MQQLWHLATGSSTARPEMKGRLWRQALPAGCIPVVMDTKSPQCGGAEKNSHIARRTLAPHPSLLLGSGLVCLCNRHHYCFFPVLFLLLIPVNIQHTSLANVIQLVMLGYSTETWRYNVLLPSLAVTHSSCARATWACLCQWLT